MTEFGKILILFGGILVATGIIFLVFQKVPFLGKLPGDIFIKKDGFTFYFPIVTSVIISIVLTIIINIFFRK